MKKNIYYYCETDNYGQKTGIVEKIELTENEYKNYKEHFLYKDYESALLSALN